MIHLSQPTFIDTIAKRFDILVGKPAKSPMNSDTNLWKTTIDEDRTDAPYSSLIGSINYCTIATCPDILYSTNKCTQFTSKPSLTHWETARRIIQYLIQSRDHGILYKPGGKGTAGYMHPITTYTDTDFTGNSNDRKSTSGWVFTFCGSPISWASKKKALSLDHPWNQN